MGVRHGARARRTGFKASHPGEDLSRPLEKLRPFVFHVWNWISPKRKFDLVTSGFQITYSMCSLCARGLQNHNPASRRLKARAPWAMEGFASPPQADKSINVQCNKYHVS